MSWIENLLIVTGISLDLFAAMECQGSLVSIINKKYLSGLCAIVGVSQMVALYIGYFLSHLIYEKNPVSNDALLGEILSVVIFFGLGIRLLVKAFKNERIQERKEEKINYKRSTRMAAVTSLYTVITGIAFGFCNTSLLSILWMILIVSVLFIVAGMYTGYHFGFEQKTKAYAGGALLLLIAGIDVIVRIATNGL